MSNRTERKMRISTGVLPWLGLARLISPTLTPLSLDFETAREQERGVDTGNHERSDYNPESHLSTGFLRRVLRRSQS
jgi:hypothetical protein